MNTENEVTSLEEGNGESRGGLLGGWSDHWHKKKSYSRKEEITMLMNQILSRENMLQALKRVEQNKGSHGVDMMPVQNLRQHILENWESIKEAILKGTYEPQCLSEESKSRNLTAVFVY